MADMLVKLYNLQEDRERLERLKEQGIEIHRALGLDRRHILSFIREEFDEGWADECSVALFRDIISCFIAVKEKKVVGFACYDATAKGFFGPMGVASSQRGSGIGSALTLRTLLAMREEGYGYAVLGWCAPKAIPLYERAVGAKLIEDSEPSVYRNMVTYDPSDFS